MSDQSYKSEADRNYADDAGTNDGRVITWGLQDIAERLDRLVEAQEAATEQARIANLIALLEPDDPREFDTWPDIARALGIQEEA